MTRKNYLTFAREAIEIEKKGLSELERNLNENFNQVVQAIKDCSGKLVFSGIGKAGLIARKTASTFSSLGKSAFFMHAAEAAHGDLGMIGKDDLVFFFSKSGQSQEVISLLNPIKKTQAKIIAITAEKTSPLYTNADLALFMGKSEEACSLGLAPTTSTTVMLVLGDLLAVSLVKGDERFNQNSFAANHPGGSLGLRLMYAKEIMRKEKDIAKVKQDATISETLLKMTGARIGLAVIVDERESLLGIFSDGDLRRLLTKNEQKMHHLIQDHMNPKPSFVSPNHYIWEVQKIMLEKKIGEIPVLGANNVCLGVVCLKDIAL